MQSITASAPNRQPLLWGVSLLLITTGLAVALSWLSPSLLAAIHPYAIQMAFNTGLGFIAAGLGLIAILYRQRSALLAICLGLALLGLLTLLDLLLGLPLNTVSWFEFMLREPPLQHQPMSPTTATAFMLSGLALAAAGQRQGYASILACLLGVLIMFIALVGILGRGFDMLPRFTWLGIKMAPHTAAGFLLLGFGLIWICQTAAIQAFNRLRFFYRLLTGFVFMCLLFLFIGSLSMLQISSVASLTQQLYQQPLQIQNAAERINSQIAQLNRELKNIAVAPERYPHQQIPALLDNSRAHIQADLQQIAQLSSSPVVAQLHSQFANWQTQILDSYTAINSGDITAYRNQLLQQIQQTAIALENLCSQLSQQAQHDMQNLDLQANKAKQQAINLMSLVVCGLLLIGVAIAALIARSLNWQLDAIRTTMLAIAEDKHQVTIPFLEHPHEIGDMAKTLAIFARNNEERHNYAQILLQHQQDLEEINRRLTQTNKELETFAYVASHDLKSPLRGISQLSGWIEEDLSSGDTEELTKHTAMMRNRIARMEKLLDDLLVFYRAGKTDGNLSQVNLAQMAQELFDIHNNKPGLRLELGNNLPRFETLATPFEQVIRNLFSNAIKHHDRDTGIIRLSCNTLDNGFYQFQVCDDGPGIPEKFQERVFGMFQTLKPRDELEGSGMGLALIKKIVETYAGHISLHSAGRGCCFTFTWPQSLSPSQPATQQKVNSHG